MYEISIKSAFSAAHSLKEIGGTCEILHGHNFNVEVSVAAGKLGREGILIDGKVLAKLTDNILEELDHRDLNDIKHFQNHNHSLEIIAKFIYDRISQKTQSHNLEVFSVTVWESDDSRVFYYGYK